MAYHSESTTHEKGIGDMAKVQAIGSHTFDTKDAAKVIIREVLYRHPLLEPITNP